MSADVAHGSCTEQSVRDGVQKHVGVGVSVQSQRMRNLYAAQNQRASFDQAVYVITLADSNFAVTHYYPLLHELKRWLGRAKGPSDALL